MTIYAAMITAPLSSGSGDVARTWLPPAASTGASQVDWLFYLILGISGFFFVAILATMIAFMIRYRQRPGREPEESPSHSLPLELTWSIIPLALVLIIFGVGFKTYLDMAVPPQGAYEINVSGQKWSWLFTYPNGHVDEKLHVPVGVPVRLVITSQDVIHSVFIPAFRIKQDAVPGRYTSLWFEARYPGEYPLYCAEYCGREHSAMKTLVVVHEPGTFGKWLEEAANLLNRMSPAEAGEVLFGSRGCTQCHTTDGKVKIGPTFLDLYGKTQALRDGTTVTVDENYIRRSIIEPADQVVAGFEPVMPSYAGRLKDPEITAVIAYLKTLSEAGRASLTPEELAAPEPEGGEESAGDGSAPGEAAETSMEGEGGQDDASTTGAGADAGDGRSTGGGDV